METEKIMSDCTLCPRCCHANRLGGHLGRCRVAAKISLARAALHFWEEPCISGENGSGAVFFSGCPMGCVFCQNRKIADGTIKKEVSVDRLAEIFVELQSKDANNINLVTPTHYAPQIVKAVEIARKNGLSIPIVYNTSGYESVEALRLLEGTVDIYLPDFKYMSEEISKRYSGAADYGSVAKAALAEMVRQCPNTVFNDNGIMQSGVIVRHMLLPGYSDDSREILKYLYSTYGDNIIISIMSQFTPMELDNSPEINRKVSDKEYSDLIDFAADMGITRAYVQEGEAADESFIPSFDFEGV